MRRMVIISSLMAAFLVFFITPTNAEDSLFEVESNVNDNILRISWQSTPDEIELRGIGLKLKLSEYADFSGEAVFTVSENGTAIYTDTFSDEKNLKWTETEGEKTFLARIHPDSGYLTLYRAGDPIKAFSKYRYTLSIPIKPSVKARGVANSPDDWNEEEYTKYPSAEGFPIIDSEQSGLVYGAEDAGEEKIPNTFIKVPKASVFRDVTVIREWQNTPPSSTTIKATDQYGEVYEYELYGETTEDNEGGWTGSQTLPLIKYEEETGEYHELDYTFSEDGRSPRVIFKLNGREVKPDEEYDTVVLTDKEDSEEPEIPMPTDQPEEPTSEPTEPTTNTEPPEETTEPSSNSEPSSPTENLTGETSPTGNENDIETAKENTGPTKSAEEITESETTETHTDTPKETTKESKKGSPGTGDSIFLLAWLFLFISIMTSALVRKANH